MAGEREGPGGGLRTGTLTDRAREALLGAVRQAARRRAGAVRPEHLLAELCTGPGMAAAVLGAAGVDGTALQARLDALLGPSAVTEGLAGPHPWDPELQQVAESAREQARALGQAYLGTEHLLLGMLADRGNGAGRLLRAAGMTLEGAQAEVRRALGLRSAPVSGRALLLPEARGARAPELALRLDAGSGMPLYRQLVEQVRELVATRRLGRGDRLPSVRQLARQLGVAPGTAARAFRELERTGLVMTERGRGTRVVGRRAFGSRPPPERITLVELFRPVVVAAFHLGAAADELEQALADAMREIYPSDRGR